MSKYVRKTRDEYSIEGYYVSEYGWEEVCAEDTYHAARETLKCYNENERGIPHRIRKHRVKIEK